MRSRINAKWEQYCFLWVQRWCDSCTLRENMSTWAIEWNSKEKRLVHIVTSFGCSSAKQFANAMNIFFSTFHCYFIFDLYSFLPRFHIDDVACARALRSYSSNNWKIYGRTQSVTNCCVALMKHNECRHLLLICLFIVIERCAYYRTNTLHYVCTSFHSSFSIFNIYFSLVNFAV